MESRGISQLADVLDGRMKDVAYQPMTLDFGEIVDGFKLKTNSYSIPIPPEDYLVCRHVTWGNKREVLTATQLTGEAGDGHHPHGMVHTSDGLGPDPSQVSWKPAKSGDHTHQIKCAVTGAQIVTDASDLHTHPDTEGAHIHAVLIPESMRKLKVGDRVLVAWVGNDPVVIDIILPATDLQKKRWDPYE